MSKPKRIYSTNQDMSLRQTELSGVNAEPKDEDSASHRKALARSELRKTFVSIGDQVAQSGTSFRNVKFPNADQVYPDSIDAMKRFCSKYYPIAKDGALFVDEPRGEKQLKEALDRHKYLKSIGVRHIVIVDESKPEAYHDAMMELQGGPDELDNVDLGSAHSA